MRLQTKLTLALAAALVPIAVMGAAARWLVADLYRAQFRRTLDDAEHEAEREYRRLCDETAAATARIARAEDPTIGRLLLELGKGALDDERQAQLADYVETQMRALGFDVLEIVDDRGQVRAAGHLPGRVGDSDPAALEVARRAPGKPRLVQERVMEGGAVQPIYAVEVAREVQARFGAGPRVVVIGGRRLGAQFLERLHFGGRLLGGDGAVLATRADANHVDAARAARWPRRLVELGDDSKVHVELVVPDDELVRTLAYIGWAAVALVLGGLALALALGFFISRRMTRPLGELADGARAVARGRLDATVPVRTRDEIGELASAFNQMTHDLSTARDELLRAERLAAWREIAQRIAHEIKNPLTPIQMAMETLQRARARDPRLFDELFTESSKTILDEVARLKHIVAEFSSFARLPAPRLAPVDLREVIDATLALYSGAVERELAEPLPPALADRDQLVQVLLNLLENARDAAGPDGKVTVRARPVDGKIELEVADSGPGIAEEVRARLFTPYFTTKARGTGLGLAIVHRIVTDHGGEIRVGGAVGQGASFTVSFRRASP